MKNDDQINQLLETAKVVLEKDIIPSLPFRKRSDALMIGEALSIALHNLNQATKAQGKDTNQNNKILSNQIRSGSYDTNLSGQITDILSKDVAERLKASNPDFIMHGRFSQFTAS
jgi:hypothetical protein